MLPETPTIAESGYNNFETTAWWGVFAPAGLPDTLAATLAGEIEAIATSDSFRRQLEPLGVVPTGAQPRCLFQISTQRTDKMGQGRA